LEYHYGDSYESLLKIFEPIHKKQQQMSDGDAGLILLCDARVVRTGRLDDDGTLTAIAIDRERGTIAAVGRSREDLLAALDMGERPSRIVRDVSLGGKLAVLPGLVDSHGHIWMHGLNLSGEIVDLTGVEAEAGRPESVVNNPCEAIEARLRVQAAVLEQREEQRRFSSSGVEKNGESGESKDDWLRGFGWDDTRPEWAGETPDRSMLDEGFATRPVWISRVDSHAGLCNTAGLRRLFGSDSDAPGDDTSWERRLAEEWAKCASAGGEIRKDPQGRVTGIFVDAAMTLVTSRLPPHNDDALLTALGATAFECAQRGITAVHDACSTFRECELLEQAVSAGRLPSLRVNAMVHGADRGSLDAALARGPFVVRSQSRLDRSVRLRVGSVKFFLDGALGSHGAAMLEPYLDKTGTGANGLVLLDRHQFHDDVLRCVSAGWQPCSHAIGDSANRVALDVYEQVLRETEGQRPVSDPRFRIEHAQIFAENDLARAGRHGIIASVQPLHCTNDSRWIESRVAKSSLVGAYAWRTLLANGARVALGSDFPVETMDVFQGMFAAVTRDPFANMADRPTSSAARDSLPAPRQTLGAVEVSSLTGGWRVGEALDIKQALHGYTVAGCVASFDEGERGSLEPGKCADFVLVDCDPVSEPPLSLLSTAVCATFVGGDCVFVDSETGELAPELGWIEQMQQTWSKSV
jgi:predicted amidohydrolase YtcJ